MSKNNLELEEIANLQSQIKNQKALFEIPSDLPHQAKGLILKWSTDVQRFCDVDVHQQETLLKTISKLELTTRYMITFFQKNPQIALSDPFQAYCYQLKNVAFSFQTLSDNQLQNFHFKNMDEQVFNRFFETKRNIDYATLFTNEFRRIQADLPASETLNDLSNFDLNLLNSNGTREQDKLADEAKSRFINLMDKLQEEVRNGRIDEAHYQKFVHLFQGMEDPHHVLLRFSRDYADESSKTISKEYQKFKEGRYADSPMDSLKEGVYRLGLALTEMVLSIAKLTIGVALGFSACVLFMQPFPVGPFGLAVIKDGLSTGLKGLNHFLSLFTPPSYEKAQQVEPTVPKI